MLLSVMLATNGYTLSDVDLLANVMWLENGHTGKTEDENIQCLIMTGVVPINRVEQGGWGGDTLEAVIYAKGQYASATKNRIGKVDIPQYVYDLARDILLFGTNIPDYVIYQSMQKNLGTRWKVIDGEYFATAGGHKDEGNDWIPEVNGNFDDLCRCYFSIFRITFRGRYFKPSDFNYWWNNYHSFVSRLDMAN